MILRVLLNVRLLNLNLGEFLKMKARIHSTESFGTVDGPGIRFITFFQGCIMGCIFCHNRDTWDPEQGKEVEIDDLIKQIEPNVNFYEKNNGGVTASGGESLYQAKFVAQYFKTVKEKFNITTTLDTSGCMELTDDVKECVKYADYILLDIKHIDDEGHIELTTRDNTLIKKFTQYIVSQKKPIWIRHVLVPGYTADMKWIPKLTDYIKSLGDVIQRVDLLPYHSMGEYKWKELGKQYKLEGVKPPSKEFVLEVKSYMEKAGLPVSTSE